jgi:hypothetical protein
MLKNNDVPAMLKTFKSQITINPIAVRRRASFIEERIHEALSKSKKPSFAFWLRTGIVTTSGNRRRLGLSKKSLQCEKL